MLENVKNSILFFLKNIQFTLRTWRNALEIARAYGYSSKDSGAKKTGAGKKRVLAVIFTVLVLLAGFLTGGYFLLSGRFHIILPALRPSQPKTAVTREFSGKKKSVPDRVQDTSFNVTLKEISDEPKPVDTLKKIIKPAIKKYRIKAVSDTGAYFLLVANKAVKSLYVLQKQDTWRVVREYDIAIGEQEGKKQTAGDRRTPEGIYFIVGRKERSELNIIYGPLAYVLNYPNEEDQREGRTGQGIWIHGTDPDTVPWETRGCIEMNNSDLVELSQLLKRGIGTPIAIVDKENLDDPLTAADLKLIEGRRTDILQDHANKISVFNTFVLEWKSAWENKNIDGYETFYDTVNFKGQGLTWPEWKERKLRTFGLYDTIAITIDNILVTDVDETTSVVKFMQLYRTNLNKIENGKKLNLEKVDDFWKITGESTCPKEELLL